jgi:hypothetical protein
LHRSVLDQSPAVHRAIAAHAEEVGELTAAAVLLFNIPDKADYWSFVDRNGGIETLKGFLANPGFLSAIGVGALSDPKRHASPEESTAIFEAKDATYDVTRAGLYEAGPAVQIIATNQSGMVLESGRIARQFLLSVDSGEIDPRLRPEEGWVFLLRSYLNFFGEQRARQVLGNFDNQADHRHYAGSVLEVMETATAAGAASSWLRGEAESAPERPAVLGDSFDWEGMIGIWARLRAGENLPDLSGEAFLTTVAIEGLIQRGEIERALDLAEETGGLNDRLTIARDVMTRQNRLCDAHGIMPGEALFLGGQLIYDFQ